MDNYENYKNFYMIQFFKINSIRQQFNLNGIEWKSFPELKIEMESDDAVTIYDEYDFANNKIEKSTIQKLTIDKSTEKLNIGKSMKTVVTDAVSAEKYKRSNSNSKRKDDFTLSGKLLEFANCFYDADWFPVVSVFTKTKLTTGNNYEIPLKNPVVVPDGKLYISEDAFNSSTCYSVAFLNDVYFDKKTKKQTTQALNIVSKGGSTGGKRNPDRERIYKLPIHKRRTDNYYNYE